MVRVLLLRPEEEIKRDGETFASFGLQVEALPLIRFQPLEFEVPNLLRFDYIYFGSKRAVRFFSQKVKKLPPSLKVIAVGRKTAQEVEKTFKTEPFLVLNGHSEELLRFAKEEKLPKGRLVAPLPEINTGNVLKLLKFGFEVLPLTVYRTEKISYPKGVVEEKLKRVQAVVFTSPSTAKALIENLQKDLKPLRRKIIVAIGKTTKKALEGFGLEVDLTPSEPSIEGVVKSLAEVFYEKGGKNLKE